MATQVGKLKNDDIQSRGPAFELTNFFGRLKEYPQRSRSFLHDVRVEMRQVTWPTRHEVFVTTWVVIITVAFFGVFFFVVDSGASWIVQRTIKFFAH